MCPIRQSAGLAGVAGLDILLRGFYEAPVLKGDADRLLTVLWERRVADRGVKSAHMPFENAGVEELLEDSAVGLTDLAEGQNTA